MRQLKITPKITQRDSSTNTTIAIFKGCPKITPEKEVELSERIQQGDMEARNQLVKSNLLFVISVARQYSNRGVELTDLISEGCIGLIRAAEKFDATKGFKFISYAVWWIRQSIENAISNGTMIRIPLNKANQKRKIQRFANEFEQKNFRAPSAEEISNGVGCTEEDVWSCLRMSGTTQSFDQPFGEECDGCLYDVLEDKSSIPADSSVDKEACEKEIDRFLNTLNEREKEIIRMSFGLGTYKESTLEEIGLHLNVTKERVRQLKEKALRKIQHHPNVVLLQSYL